ncbi:netrin-4-like isoform X1 [Sinocyclocheilus grahami]|uniref:Netrin-4-like n=1 Tax=Sinocyclocheilus grahami TaxID=75366 RepID=A0A672RMB6_SINGR|nr:PREDICTED: netrin-4-like isoform X1 [Sinocyclocheilus grahami]
MKHLRSPQFVMVILKCAVILFPGFLQGFTESRCVGRACSPPMGNLASGRTLFTLTSCCTNSSSCLPTQPRCLAELHPPALMADDPFIHPDTWWGSAAATGEQEEIRLDLETRFCMSHVVMLFRSPRPAAMRLERSQDFGQTWETLKLFARNCTEMFGLPGDVSQPGSLCTSRYSNAVPCSRGEIIFRSIGLRSGIVDPYSPEALARLTVTNLRIQLLKSQQCPILKGKWSVPDQSNLPFLPTIHSRSLTAPTPSSDPLDSTPFAVYSLLAKGTCLCHGHAEHCLPENEGQDSLQPSNVVSGKCVCTHHTAGEHCERCAPLYNDQPWRAANGSSGESNPCQKCECHGHAESCHFSQRMWLSTGGNSGGVCDNCQHNTVGRWCQRCHTGYHRHPARPLNSPHACIRCWCDPVGSVLVLSGDGTPWCHPRSGQCHCKLGVGGTTCSHCLAGYWGFGEEGCKSCVCSLTCDPITGHCRDSKGSVKLYNVPIGGKIPELSHFKPQEDERAWPKELAISALYYTGKCSCKEKKLKSVSDLCKIKQAYVIKASVLSAHDKGTHAVVLVKVRKVFRSGKLPLSQGTYSLYPLSWTSRGCTCPILNPGGNYLLAGPEDVDAGRLLVTMQSLVVLWTPILGFQVTEALHQGCL